MFEISGFILLSSLSYVDLSGLLLVFEISWFYFALQFELYWFFWCIDETLRFYTTIAVMGKVEGQGESWHGHVTAVTVAPDYRRQQLAKKLMNLLEDFSDKM